MTKRDKSRARAWTRRAVFSLSVLAPIARTTGEAEALLSMLRTIMAGDRTGSEDDDMFNAAATIDAAASIDEALRRTYRGHGGAN